MSGNQAIHGKAQFNKLEKRLPKVGQLLAVFLTNLKKIKSALNK